MSHNCFNWVLQVRLRGIAVGVEGSECMPPEHKADISEITFSANHMGEYTGVRGWV